MFASTTLYASSIARPQRPQLASSMQALNFGPKSVTARSAMESTVKGMSLAAPSQRLFGLGQTSRPASRLAVVPHATPDPEDFDLTIDITDETEAKTPSDDESSDQKNVGGDDGSDDDLSAEELTNAQYDQIIDELEMLEADVDDGSASDSDSERGQIISVDPAQLMALLKGDLDPSQLNRISEVTDKARFFEKLGVSPNENCGELSGDDEQVCQFTHSTAQLAWEEYQTFHLDELEKLQNIDRLETGAAVAAILKDDSVDSTQRAKLTYVFNLLMDKLNMLQNLDIEPYRQTRGLDGMDSDGQIMKDELPLQIGQLAEVMELHAGFKQLFEATGGSIASNGVSFNSGLKVKQSDEYMSHITFADVAGIDEAKAELTEVVEFLKNPEKFQEMGARIPRGVLLEGGPGVGKTLLAKAVAGEAGVPFFSVAGSEFVEEFVGVGAKRVRDLFDQARKQGTCIIFIDEIDAVGRARNGSPSGGGQEHEQTLNQMLVEMDGFGRDANVIILGATNRADLLDSALTRPGRFDRKVQVPLPAVDGREAILRVHAKKVKIGNDVNLRAVAKLTGGFSGAELENLVNEAALQAIRNGNKKITAKDFELARDRQIMGLEMPGYQLSEKDKLMTAYHEAGHALVSHYMDGGNDVFKVTIMPRGNSLGSTHYMPEAENGSVNKKQLFARLASLLGGRMAEGVFYGEDEVTTGASSDLFRASQLARRMVAEWGFSDKIGVSNLQYNGQVLPMSPQTAQVIDDEVARLLGEADAAAKDIIVGHRSEMDTMANLLVEKETIDAKDMAAIVKSSS